MKILLEGGADADKASSNGATPLFVTSQGGELDVVRWLVEEGKAEVGKDADEGMGMTPLTMAILSGKDEIVDYLKERVRRKTHA